MSNRVICRDASHSGSWYSSSGNCQSSTVGVSMLCASYVCASVFLTAVCCIDVLGSTILCHPSECVDISLSKSLTDARGSMAITSTLTQMLINVKSQLR